MGARWAPPERSMGAQGPLHPCDWGPSVGFLNPHRHGPRAVRAKGQGERPTQKNLLNTGQELEEVEAKAKNEGTAKQRGEAKVLAPQERLAAVPKEIKAREAKQSQDKQAWGKGRGRGPSGTRATAGGGQGEHGVVKEQGERRRGTAGEQRVE
ncbi:hypothetical protein KFL_009690010 [Klebsormidium nitens]|uniref:Uncharacterized protein n=1 Tax=Klebsormidium nitens TaxID=105231 RepID=A0A1Y1ISN9_KLENI|nr:hypothetical protein KFL_009690010 [Klebsormidium nitens]|eukprot:GAQ92291.1 hypothetical protein KFL_009690010 [Klebsormidium nitens]